MTMAGGSGIHRPDRVVKREYGARCIAEGLADGERPCCWPGHDVGGGVEPISVRSGSAAHWTTATS